MEVEDLSKVLDFQQVLDYEESQYRLYVARSAVLDGDVKMNEIREIERLHKRMKKEMKRWQQLYDLMIQGGGRADEIDIYVDMKMEVIEDRYGFYFPALRNM